MDTEKLGFTARIVHRFLTSHLSVLFIIISLIVGAAALILTPREEEPQITVPMTDIFIQMPGASPEEVERLAAARLEKLLMEVDGVENVMLMARPGGAVVTVQFYVGEDRERSLVKLYNKIQSNMDRVPAEVAGWAVKPIEVDDVPIISVTFYSDRYDDYQLRRMVEEIEYQLQEIPAVGRSYIIGGHKRQITISLDADRLAAHNISPLEVAGMLQAANVRLPAGSLVRANEETVVEIGDYLQRIEEVESLVVGVFQGRPVYVRDVATVKDGPEEIKTYTWIGFGPAAEGEIGAERGKLIPAVTLAIAKKKGENAVAAAEEIIRRGYELRDKIIPDDVQFTITRNYGETANEKVNELIEHLLIAVITIVVLLALTLGIKEALVVALAVPMTLAFTLFGDTLAGFTINRVTLFALILSLGLLVDDPIVDVENIYRHFQLKKHPPLKATLIAVDEVRPPTILATLTVILSFLPMFFVTGMMGPYMRPMPFNVSLAMVMSLVVAFTVTPWATYHVLKKEHGHLGKPVDIRTSRTFARYSRLMTALTRTTGRAWGFLLIVGLLFVGSVMLALGGLVPMKMLPFDNKNELQLVIDMPEGTTLETTDAVAREYAEYLSRINEVRDFEIYTGTDSPFDFNGLVRHYYLRRGPHMADIRINLAGKRYRKQKSHDIALRIRRDVERIAAKHGANVKIVEGPPGPPVLATAVAEVYAAPWVTLEQHLAAARAVRAVFEREESVRDVDDFIEADQRRVRLVADKEKAMLHGITTEEIARTIAMASGGGEAGILHHERERNRLHLHLQLPLVDRADLSDLLKVRMKARDGSMIPLSELVSVQEGVIEKTIMHKNGRRVQFIMGDIIGESPYKAILAMGKAVKELDLPDGIEVNWLGEGEWKITVDAFRDLGLAFLGALVLIYILLVIQTHSTTIPLVIMVAIPLTLIGIMPGFWLLNALFAGTIDGFKSPIFFTATGMIGMIALAGIVVRNSIILIDFIERSWKECGNLLEALIYAGSVRMRPILLTAGAAMMGAWVIALDPIFSGLAWSFIFGIFASTAFSLVVVPVVYYLLNRGKSGPKQPPTMEIDAA